MDRDLGSGLYFVFTELLRLCFSRWDIEELGIFPLGHSANLCTGQIQVHFFRIWWRTRGGAVRVLNHEIDDTT